ncbi:MAG: phenylalanine--tRNA ligase beta subunit-related protein [Planctomycetota bacterium]
MNFTLTTNKLGLGIVIVRDATLAADYEPLPDPEPFPGRDIADARKLYRAIHLDPTHSRPASEALWRRVTRGKGMPRINQLVDVVNHCSVCLLRPFGSYDLAKVDGDVTVRLGEEGEWYAGHGKPRVNLAGRYVLADAAGPFGNPSSDSVRTSIGAGTTDALIVVFGPADLPEDRLDWVGETITAEVGGTFEAQIC